MIWNVQILFRDLHSVDASMLGKRYVSAKIQKGTIHLKEFFTFTSVEKKLHSAEKLHLFALFQQA